MDSLLQLLKDPLFLKALHYLAYYWVFSAAVGAMPTPTQPSANASTGWFVAHHFYGFIFRLGHLLAGNINRAMVAMKVPGAATDGN